MPKGTCAHNPLGNPDSYSVDTSHYSLVRRSNVSAVDAAHGLFAFGFIAVAGSEVIKRQCIEQPTHIVYRIASVTLVLIRITPVYWSEHTCCRMWWLSANFLCRAHLIPSQLSVPAILLPFTVDYAVGCYVYGHGERTWDFIGNAVVVVCLIVCVIVGCLLPTARGLILCVSDT
jgi:hypothetical protein